MSLSGLSKIIKDNLGSILRWGILGILAYAISYGDGRWAKQEALASTELKLATDMGAKQKEIIVRFAPLEALPNKIENLEKWQTEQKALQAADGAQFKALQDQLNALQTQISVSIALQREQKDVTKENFDRILRKLDK